MQLADEAATASLGRALARALPDSLAGWLILADGDLGAGKTTLARSLLRGLGHDGPVPSPTYTLVEPYTLAAGEVYHVDLYRIVDPEELEFLGWTELRAGLAIIEWPNRVPGLAAEADLIVRLAYDETGGRNVELQAISARAAPILDSLSVNVGDS